MYNTLESGKIDFIFDTAYMEEDFRTETNRLGFCEKHYGMISTESNRLGLALILETHLKTVNEQLLKKAKSMLPTKKAKAGKNNNSPLNQLITDHLNNCYVCETVQVTFDIYLDTLIYLYKKDPNFKKLFESTNGYCMKHFGLLYDMGGAKLSGDLREAFISTLILVYENNINELQKDMSWFIRKFDYRFKDDPWGNAKTAIPRTIQQLSSIKIKD